MAGIPQSLPDRIAAALRRNFPPETIIDVAPSGVRDNLHVLVVSRTLDNMTEQQKQTHLWELLDQAVAAGELTAEELQRVSLVLPVSVDELRR